MTQTSVSPAGSKDSTSNDSSASFSSVKNRSVPSAERSNAEASAGRRTSTGKSEKFDSPIVERIVAEGVKVIFFRKSVGRAKRWLTIVSSAPPATASMP